MSNGTGLRQSTPSPTSSPSSGGETPPPQPPLPPPGPSAPLGASYISTMFTGLIRRFSSEDNSLGSQLSNQLDGSTQVDDPEDHRDLPQPLNAAAAHRPGWPKDDGIAGVFMPVHRTASPFRPPPLEPLVLRGYRDGTTRLLTPGVAEEVRSMVPERLKIVEDWSLVYNLEQDGASLATLYQKAKMCERKRAGFVLVVKDLEGSIFGAYLSEYPRPAPSYFGNGECFLWRASHLAALPPPPSQDTTHVTRSTTLPLPRSSQPRQAPNAPCALAASVSRASTPSDTIRFKAFPYSGLNDYYINCETGFLSVGSGGGHYGLWLDDGLDIGHSSRCETFGNEPLSDEGDKFRVLGVELWVIGA